MSGKDSELGNGYLMSVNNRIVESHKTTIETFYSKQKFPKVRNATPLPSRLTSSCLVHSNPK